jgi:hypothetical protein
MPVQQPIGYTAAHDLDRHSPSSIATAQDRRDDDMTWWVSQST